MVHSCAPQQQYIAEHIIYINELRVSGGWCCRCHFELLDGGGFARVRLEGNDQGLAPGQYAAFYEDGVCLGSGVIQEAPSCHHTAVED